MIINALIVVYLNLQGRYHWGRGGGGRGAPPPPTPPPPIDYSKFDGGGGLIQYMEEASRA